ncbi:hypothetical protein AB0J12_39165, partial [Streptomyces sp. NPDC049915]
VPPRDSTRPPERGYGQVTAGTLDEEQVPAPDLCAAIVDRLTFNGTIIDTGTDSYRLASTRAEAPATAS